MEAHRTEATVGGDGSVVVRGVPFAEGAAVEVIVLPARSEPAPQPVPAATDRPRRTAGSAKGLITVPDDFDDPLDDFAEYM